MCECTSECAECHGTLLKEGLRDVVDGVVSRDVVEDVDFAPVIWQY